MKNLGQLLEDESGRQFLRDNGVYVSLDEFSDALKEPANGGPKKVYGAQQLYMDYALGVSTKVAALRDLSQRKVETDFIWIDTDRAGSDNLITRFYWPGIGVDNAKGYGSVSVKKAKHPEIRFVELDRDYLDNTGKDFRKALEGSGKYDPERFDRFWDNFEEKSRLVNLNLGLTEFLFKDYFGYFPNPVVLSKNLDGEFSRQLGNVIENMPAVIDGINGGIDYLESRDVDPQIGIKDETYLPIYVTCQNDGKRNPLRRVDDDQPYAAANCSCGDEMKFPMGQELSVDNIIRDATWSPDVTLPFLTNDSYSGGVVGKSSALYGIVLNRVMRNVLEKEPIPLFVPVEYTDQLQDIKTGLIPNYFNRK